MLNFWTASIFARYPAKLRAVGVALLATYAVMEIGWSPVGSLLGGFTALVGLVAALRVEPILRRDTVVWLLLAVIAIQVTTWIFGSVQYPQWTDTYPKLDRLARLFMFIGFAWWLGGSTRNTLVLWALAAVGVLAAALFDGNGLNEALKGLRGARVDFDIRNAQHTGMLFGTVLLGLLALAWRCISHGGRISYWRTALWAAAVSLSFVGVVVSQARAAWLGLGVALALMAVVWAAGRLKRGETSARPPMLLPIGIAVVLIAAVSASISPISNLVERRLAAESHVVDLILEGRPLQDFPYSSFGIRLHTWNAAVDRAVQRPVVGWGDDASKFVFRESSSLPARFRDGLKHTHNSLLEIFLSYETLGVLFFLGLAVWLGWAGWYSWRAGVLPGDLFLFVSAFFPYWLVVNTFESYLFWETGVFVHNIVLAGLLTHYWRARYRASASGR